MNKRRLHHVWTRIRQVRPWHLVLAGLLCLSVGVYALRENNLRMVQLRAAVYEADRTGGDVQGALTDLQRYVTSHMNTDLSGGSNAVYPPVQLKHSYERAQAAISAQSGNEQVYIDAQVHCERTNPEGFSGRFRVPCIQEYVRTHGASTAQVPDSLYKYDFMSPVWSPDLAGFAVLATMLCFSLALGLWVFERWLKSKV